MRQETGRNSRDATLDTRLLMAEVDLWCAAYVGAFPMAESQQLTANDHAEIADAAAKHFRSRYRPSEIL